jgi:hypothetical protein
MLDAGGDRADGPPGATRTTPVTTTARRARPRRRLGPGRGRAGGSSTLGAVGAAWALWALALVGLATVPWFDHLTRRAGRPDLSS